jgi:hypothetical protein
MLFFLFFFSLSFGIVNITRNGKDFIGCNESNCRTFHYSFKNYHPPHAEEEYRFGDGYFFEQSTNIGSFVCFFF